MEFRDRKFVKSMIVITHDLSILAQIADTILIMYAGKLAEKADAATVVNSPLHPYTQLLLASLPEVGVRYDESALVGIPGRPPSLLNPPRGCRFRERCPVRFRQVRRGTAVHRTEAGPSSGVLESDGRTLPMLLTVEAQEAKR